MRICHISNSSNSVCDFETYFDENMQEVLCPEEFIDCYQEKLRFVDIFVINAFYRPEEKEYSDQDGIRLLKYLRMNGFRQHCLVYSVVPLEFLLGNGLKNSILLSEGVTYIDKAGIITEDFCASLEKKLSIEDPSPYFLPEVNELLRLERHNMANWWGLLRTFSALRQIDLSNDSKTSQAISEVLDYKSSYEGRLMEFIKFRGASSGEMLYPHRLDSIRKKLKAIRNKNMKVVYIDDQASKGWAFVLRHIFYCSGENDRFIVPAISEQQFNASSYADLVIKENPDMVILDLRLTPNDRNASIQDLSGMKILKELETRANGSCPVLVFTASDKHVASETAFDEGADGFWIKEGLDESGLIPSESYFDFSFSRVEDLISQIHTLSSEDYVSLYSFNKRVRELESSEEEYWWTKSSWFPNDAIERRPISKQEVIRCLKNIFLIHKQFLISSSTYVKQCQYDMLTIELCKILEAVHYARTTEEGGIMLLKARAKEDWGEVYKPFNYVSFLIRERNSVAHGTASLGGHVIDCRRYNQIVDVFIEYLTMSFSDDPCSEVLTGKLERCEGAYNNFFYKFQDKSGLSIRLAKALSSDCAALLGDRSSLEGISLKVIKSPNSFNLYSVVRHSSDITKTHWTAKAKMGKNTSTHVEVTLSSISPRGGFCFLIPENLWQKVEVGTKIFFHPSINDSERNFRSFLDDVCLELPTLFPNSYWSAEIYRKNEAFEKKSVFLTNITPPFNAFFVVSHGDWKMLQIGEMGGLIAFRPMWSTSFITEKPYLSSPVDFSQTM